MARPSITFFGNQGEPSSQEGALQDALALGGGDESADRAPAVQAKPGGRATSLGIVAWVGWLLAAMWGGGGLKKLDPFFGS